MSEDKLHKYQFTVDGSEIEGFKGVDPGDLKDDLPVVEVGKRVRKYLGALPNIELKHDPRREGRHGEQQAFYKWMKEIAEVPVEPWTFPVHDETQGPDWLVVYARSYFTGMSYTKDNGVSIGAMLSAREVWLRCPHGMISDDETEAMWMAEKFTENRPLDAGVGYEAIRKAKEVLGEPDG